MIVVGEVVVASDDDDDDARVAAVNSPRCHRLSRELHADSINKPLRKY